MLAIRKSVVWYLIPCAKTSKQLVCGLFFSAVTFMHVEALGATAARSAAVPYCANLNGIIALAFTKEGFASITVAPRDGNFFSTSQMLPGWGDCALYGTRTYTCDSLAVSSAKKSERLQAYIVRQIKGCLGSKWKEANDRSSSKYVVLHPETGPISITLSTDEIDKGKHVVRLTLFLRGSQT